MSPSASQTGRLLRRQPRSPVAGSPWSHRDGHRLRRVAESPLRAYRAARHLVEWLVYDRRQAADTGRTIPLESFGLDAPDREQYQPTRWTTLRRVLPKNSVQQTDVFVDFGSGMGRAVQQAAAYPFARLVGVEISPELNDIARASFDSNKRRFTCQRAEFVTSDAAEFQVPDDMTHAYMFNPFSGETFQAVLRHIVASIDRKPRRVLLIYHGPEMEAMVEACGRFQLVDEKQTTRTVKTRIYESIAAG